MSAAVVLGRPARHARTLRATARRRMLLCVGVGLFAAGLFGLAWSNPGWSLRLPALAVAALVTLVATGFGRGFAVTAARTGAGVAAEDATARALERLPVAAVVHNARLGRGDVDHVVLGPVCWAVETKYGRGVPALSRGRFSVGGRVLPRDPLGQARASAQAVSRSAGVPAQAVLVVSGAEGPPQWLEGVWVGSPAALPGLLASSPAVLDAGRASRVAAALPVDP